MPAQTTDRRIASVSLQAKIEFLSRASSYPEGPKSVEPLETHMSWVFLTDTFAHKLKKPVRHAFLDFSTVEARRYFCDQEVKLNRELAAGVYIGTVPLCLGRAGALQLGEDGTVVDWLVKSHRLPAARTLDRMIERGEVTERDISEVALLLARFYRRSAPIVPGPSDHRRRFEDDLHAIRRELTKPEHGLSAESIDMPVDALLQVLRKDAALFDDRIMQHRIVEAHGDLRPEHVYLTAPPVILDRLEFNRAFRILDPVEELAFLAMECDLLGAPWIGESLFATYTLLADDDPPERLIPFYKSYRACLRAKISAWHTREPREVGASAWIGRARSYLALAGSYIPSLK